ncbi:hypothetical protein BRADI_3g13945v3 [Brachypodium distachyon]|uniref:Uncharacterized protein n=1 Tax=Brachypodium distachyon TaxID=15368 RepID=A0A0Q3LQS4_BRADI|nr:hypothetical protein BRADI_3g13945v3 [Brachypodium distachyon]
MDTGNFKNVRYQLTQYCSKTTCSIYHNKDFVISSSLSVDLKDREGSWKEHFKKISMEERSKFDEETLSNLEGVKTRKTYSMKTDGSKNEYIVVTLLVAADETLNLPEAIRSAADLEAAVLRLNSTPEILWTPQDEDDVLSEERMQKDYPYLKPLLRGDN